jgi:ABC-2 type transport system permease protein
VTSSFLYLLLPTLWTSRNRVLRRERGDTTRALVFAALGVAVFAVLFAIVFWLTWQLLDYEELGDYLIRLGFSWLFLTFLSFVGFSAVVASLSTFFLSEDLRLLLSAPIPADRLFYARFSRTVVQASWMVAVFLLPVLLAVGLARCASGLYYVTAVAVALPFVVIPCALGAVITLVLVNVFPARRARDILLLMGLLFAVVLIVLLRFLRPEQLLSVQSLPDVTAFFATIDSPVTPLLPSFWAGEALFASLVGRMDWLHLGSLWTTALAFTVLARLAFSRSYFDGVSRAQEARKARFSHLASLERILNSLPISPESRWLTIKDAKVFLRDTAQWSQLLLLAALALVYLYNFRVLDLDRIPYMSGVIRNGYAFVNLAMAAFVMSAVAVRFVFPAVSVEGPAFWIVRTAPVSMRRFLWSKFWLGLVPVLTLALGITVASNSFLRARPFLHIVGGLTICLMTFALVGLAAGMGACYPRFQAENVTAVAGSFGGVAFMVLAVLFTVAIVGLVAWPSFSYIWYDVRGLPLPPSRILSMAFSFGLAVGLCVLTWLLPMRKGVLALETME